MADDTTTTTEDSPEGYTPPAEADRKGYAVYDATLGRYVGGVTTDKPTAKDAKGLVREGHEVEVRAV